MFFPGNTSAKPAVVSQTGAHADSILCGTGPNNRGLRIRILQAQAKGDDGPIRGNFVLLSTGDDRHALTLAPFLGKITNAQETLRALRRHSPACVHVVNAGALAVEANRVEGTVSDPDCSVPVAPHGNKPHERPPTVYSDPDA